MALVLLSAQELVCFCIVSTVCGLVTSSAFQRSLLVCCCDNGLVCAAVGDCQTSKKACADCTCGRADAEAAGIKAELTPDMLENPQSACGSVSHVFLMQMTMAV